MWARPPTLGQEPATLGTAQHASPTDLEMDPPTDQVPTAKEV